MFGFTPKLPINEEQRQWVNDGFHRLEIRFQKLQALAGRKPELRVHGEADWLGISDRAMPE